MNAKLKRISAGHYKTTDGIFSICKQQNGYDYNQNWFILHVSFDEAVADEFPTKHDAVRWLKRQYELKEDWLFKEFTV